jgi:hypothetical protein
MPATSPRHLLLRLSKHARMTCVDIATQACLDWEAGPVGQLVRDGTHVYFVI